MDNCIVWGFDVTNLNNKQLIYSQIERMYGGRVAGQVKRMSDDEYPLIIVSHGKVRYHLKQLLESSKKKLKRVHHTMSPI